MSSVDLKNIKRKPASKKDSNTTDLLAILNKDISIGGKKLKDKQKEAFYSELSVLLEAGMDIRSALDVIVNETGSKKEKELFETIKKAVINGQSLSESLKEQPQFTNYEYYSVQIGEETGKLASVLKDLADYFKRSIQQKRQVINALTYPVIVLSVAVMAVIFMMYFIVPMFADVFQRFDKELPAITQFVVNASEWIGEHLWKLALVVATIIITLYTQRTSSWFRKYSSKVIVMIPFIGDLIRKIHLARFCNVMNLLIASKVNLLRSIELIGKMAPFYPIEIALEQMQQEITNGTPLNDSMRSYKIFDTKMVSLIKVGEEVNQLESFFDKIAQQYNDEIEHKTSILGNLIEPFMLLFLGLVVGTILIAMYLPLFQLSTSFGG